MADVTQVFTFERRLFRTDSIPWPFVLAESNQEGLRARYKFTQLGQEVGPMGAVGVIAPRGEFLFGGRAYLVEQFSIEPNALQAQISGDSKLADAFLEDVTQFLREISPGGALGPSAELARTYQTTAIAKLSVAFEAIFAGSVERFLRESAVPRLSRPDAKATIQLSSLSWLVSYQTPGTEYALMPRLLTIEPRAGTKPEERIYHTVSPTDFRGHLEILEAFERTFSVAEKSSKVRSAPAKRRKV